MTTGSPEAVSSAPGAMTCWPGSPSMASNSSRPSEFNPSRGLDNCSCRGRPGGEGHRYALRPVVQEGCHGVVELSPPRGVVDRRDGSGAGRGERPVPVSGDAGHLVVLPLLEVGAGQVNVVAG